jgi:hypothetical protein
MDFYNSVCDIQKTDNMVVGLNQVNTVHALHGFLQRNVKSKILHLTRDPRGFANSCKKYFKEYNHQLVARIWTNEHDAIERLGLPPYNYDVLHLRYEDLCKDPQAAMRRVFEFLGVESDKDCVLQADLDKFHLMGNKMLSSYNGEIKLDLSWQENLSITEQNDMIRLTFPLSEKYEYRA